MALRDLSQHLPGGYPGSGRGLDNFPKFSPDGQSIAFRTNRNGGEEVYVMDANGTNKINVTNHSALDLEFDWSPDGAQIVFTRLVQETYVIYVINTNGSGLVQVTNSSINSRYAAWSPDGTRIAYSRLITSGNTSFWQVVVRSLVDNTTAIISDSTQVAVFPQWSKDSKRIYYNIQRVGLGVRAVDASYNKILVGHFPRSLSWSPDGKEFLDADSLGITAVNADLTSMRRLS